MRIRVLCFLLSVFALSQSAAAAATAIAVLGDSLTAGYGVTAEQAFPARLEHTLVADGYAAHVLNDGVSGDTTAGGLARVEYVLQQKPDIVIIELGANDLLRALPVEGTKHNLEAIMQRFQEAHIHMLLTGEKAAISLGSAYAHDYDAMFQELAQRYHAVLYPFFLEGVYGHAELMQADGLHPNPHGVDVIVTNIAPLVEGLLKK